MPEPRYTIGFSNLSESLSFTAQVRASIEAAAAGYPELALLVRNNDMNGELALQHAHEFTEVPVDVAVIINTVERMGTQLGSLLLGRGIPLIAIEIPIPMSIFLGIDNERAGRLAGEMLARWVQLHWSCTLDKVLILTDARHVTNIQNRLKFAVEELTRSIPYRREDVLFVDAGSLRDTSAERVYTLLQSWDGVEKIGVMCDNDDTAVGALDAARALGREQHLAVVGQNATLGLVEFSENPGSRLIGTIDFHPDQYGPRLVELVLDILHKRPHSRSNLIQPHPVLSPSFEG